MDQVVRRARVQAAQAGDERAFAELVHPLLGPGIGAATLIARSRAVGEEAVQDALLDAWQGIRTLREPSAFGTWFRRLVIRAAVRHARRERRRATVGLDEVAGTWSLQTELDARRLARAFDQMQEKDRVLLTLHHYLGLAVAETAEIVNVPPGTVKSRVHYALRRLRAAYEAEDRA